MDLDQFRKIYSDFRLFESRAKADQYKAWDYSSQHMNMRVPLDKRQYDPRKEEADELYYRDDKFVQRPQPFTRLSHLSPTITGGINSKLAGKDFRDTTAKFATYGELFNHVPMIPDVINIVKQMLNPLQIEIFVESLNSMEQNDKSPGLILSTLLVEFIRKMTSSLLSANDSLQNNNRRLYLDSLNRLETLQTDFSYKTLPSKAAELLARLAYMVLTSNETKQDNFDAAITKSEPDITNNAANAAGDMNIQNILNLENSVRAQSTLDTRPLRETQPQLESINSNDYANGGRLFLQLYSDFLDQVTTAETPMPTLKSEARSSTKTSSVKTINTDTKSKIPPKAPTLKDLLRKLVQRDKEDGKKDDDENDDDKPDDGDLVVQIAPQAPQPPRATPQGPTMIAPNNATMVPTQPTPAQTVPIVVEGETLPGTTTQIVPIQTVDTQTVPVDTVDKALIIPPTQKQVTDQEVVTKKQLEPPTVKDALGNDFIQKPWLEQAAVLYKMPDTAVSEMFIMSKAYADIVTNNESLFYVNPPARLRLYLLLSSFRTEFPTETTPLEFVRGKVGLSKENTDPLLYKAVQDAIMDQTAAKAEKSIPITPKAEETEEEKANRPKKYRRNPATGRMEGYGKRGRGRPKRVREDEEIESSDKKARVQPSSSLSSISLPVQVSDTSNVLDKHKNDIVTSITVKRSPIPQFMDDLFESLSNGTWSQLKKKHGFDSFFHLAAVINDTILIEKNSNGINVADYKPYDSEEIQVPSKLLGKFTLGQMVENVKNEMGPDFYSYHPFENNCQNFMFRFLKDSKALTPQIAEFVSQPIENLVKDLPEYFPPLVKTAADIYGVIQPMLNPNP
jgi:hypothetical protein